jgi:hypothetical protein
MSNIFQSILTGIEKVAPSLSSTDVTNIATAVAGTLSSSTEQAAAPLMTTLQNAFGNTVVIGDTVTKLQELPGMPSLQIAQLQSLRTVTDPNVFQQTITAIDAALENNSQTSGWSIAKAFSAL